MGGGIRSMLSIKYWLNSGLSKLVIGSYAIEEYNQFVTSFDSEVRSRIIVALDIMILDGLPTIRIHGWQKDSKMNLLSTIKSFVDNGFKDFLITDISKDGTLEGPNIDLYRQINEKFKEINVIASGGVSKFSDLIKLDDISMQSVVVGKSLLENKITDQEVIQFLQKE
jgi:phosphoribosylformimino-5-aminoimidazole carboxamide ribotide isomerase